MDFNELSLTEIHKSIESTLNNLKLQLQEIESLILDPSGTKEVIDDVLRPVCQNVKVLRLTNSSSIRKLVIQHQELLQSVLSSSNTPALKAKKTKSLILPPVQTTRPNDSMKPRPPMSAGVRYPAISPSLTQSPKASHSVTGLTPSFCRVKSPTSGASKPFGSSLTLMEKQASLKRFCEQFETCNCKLQEMFTTSTQKILVPLQTFCKHTRKRKCSATGEEISNDAIQWEKKLPRDLNKNEFVLVEMLNRCRQLLWQSGDCPLEALFSSENPLNELLTLPEYEDFLVVRLHYDVLQTFAVVIKCASLWLKRDEIYTENSKCGLLRAHRRFVKTQRMWQEARQTQRELSEQWKQTLCDIKLQENRLETLQNDMETLQENLVKLQDQRQTVEIQLLNSTEGMNRLRAKHRDLRKLITASCKKLEAKERSCELMMSRLRTLKADREAGKEKVEINQDFVKSIQDKMVQIYQDREAWRYRYEEKTDPKTLKKKLDSVGLRVPSVIVREKTFVLKSRSENLRDATTIVRSRLQASGTHWSLLCHYLNWPKQFLLTLRSSSARVRRRAFSDRDSSSSSSSGSSQNEEDRNGAALILNPSVTPSVTTQRIINYVRSNCPGSNDDQCEFMLKLWLDKNGQLASLEQLVKALHDVRTAEGNLTTLQQSNT